jgi:cytosol aminopeptidase
LFSSNLDGKIGKSKVFHHVNEDFASIAICGLGKDGIGFNQLEAIDEGMVMHIFFTHLPVETTLFFFEQENVRVGAGVGALDLQDSGCKNILIDPMEYAEQAAEGSSLALWKYQDNIMKLKRSETPKLELYDSSENDAWTRGLFKADAQNLARTLCDAPSNQITPTAFAQVIQTL